MKRIDRYSIGTSMGSMTGCVTAPAARLGTNGFTTMFFFSIILNTFWTENTGSETF